MRTQKIDRQCDITPACDVESTRYALGGVYWDEERMALVATDSRILAVVQPPENDGDDVPPASGVIPRQIIEAGFEHLKRNRRLSGEIAINEKTASVKVSVDGRDAVFSDALVNGKFPLWPEVLPRKNQYSGFLYFDARILKRADPIALGM